MRICVDLALIRAASGSLLLPWRGREADLWREDSNVIWCYLGLEESSAKNGDLLSVKLNSVGLNPMTYWDDTWYGVIFHFSVDSADLVGHLKARLLANSHTLNVGYMGTPLPFSPCFSLHSSMKNLTLKFIFFYFIFKLYIIVLVLPNIKMNPPQVRGKKNWLMSWLQFCYLHRNRVGGTASLSTLPSPAFSSVDFQKLNVPR